MHFFFFLNYFFFFLNSIFLFQNGLQHVCKVNIFPHGEHMKFQEKFIFLDKNIYFNIFVQKNIFEKFLLVGISAVCKRHTIYINSTPILCRESVTM